MPNIPTNSPQAQSPFAAFRAAAWSVAGAVSLASAGVLVASSYLPSGALQKALESVAAVGLAVGLIQVLSDAWLHRRLSEAILQEVRTAQADTLAELEGRFATLEHALEVDQRVRPSGVLAVERQGTDWYAFLDGAHTIDILPTDLTAWLQDLWDAVKQHGMQQRIEVNLHLPNVNGMGEEVLGALELRFNRDRDRLREDFDETVDAVSENWRTSGLIAGSVLRIHTYERPASLGLVMMERRWALLVPPAAGTAPASRGLVIQFQGGTDPGFEAWARAQPDALNSEYYDEETAT